MAALQSGGVSGGMNAVPFISTQKLASNTRVSPLLPTHCLSCNHPLPYPVQAPPHEQGRGAPSGGGGSVDEGRGWHEPGTVAPTFHALFIAGDAPAKLAYGKEPQNETRRRTQQLLSTLAANGNGGSTSVRSPVRGGSARPQRGASLNRDSVDGIGLSPMQRPTSAPSYHDQHRLKASQSASGLLTVLSSS